MFESLFSQLDVALPGLKAISVVGNDGIEVDQFVKEDIAHDVLSAEMTGITRTLERLQVELSLGRLQEVVIRTDAQNVFIFSLTNGLFILLVTDASAATGKARYEVQKIAHKFSEML
jgi:predicted regulator of Ras-like GTPase activity (Roadblock/LC7/MglB family)